MADTAEVRVVRVGPILPHPNADKLALTMVGGFQVVIGKEQFNEGDLAVYIQPDSVVPQTAPFAFIWGGDTVRCTNHTDDPKTCNVVTDEVPAKRRRITVKRLRKEYSEGLLMSLTDLGFPQGTNENPYGVREGEDVAETLGVTRYVPEFDIESAGDTAASPKRRYPKTVKGWFFYVLFRLGFKGAGKSFSEEVSFSVPEYDVNALKNATRVTFREGEAVTVTEKIHGSNARAVFIPDNDENPLGSGKFYVGSHYQWKKQGDGIFWKAVEQHPFIEEFCTQHPGLVLYFEVGPTQKGFRYGCDEGETFAFSYDVYNPETKSWEWPGNYGVEDTAPLLYVGPYSDTIVKHADGMSAVPHAQHLREGIVIHSRERRLKLKVVSNQFYVGESK